MGGARVVVAVGVITAALAACEPVIEPVELPLKAALLAEDGSVVGTQADGGPYSYSPPAGREVIIVPWDDVPVTAPNVSTGATSGMTSSAVRR